METSRTKNSFFNMSSNFLILIVQTILSFVTRTIFIRVLGETNLGLDGLFTNILSMLSITELGVSTAISFILYKPLNDKNNKKIGTIMSFYRRMYAVIGSVIFALGLLLIPFLKIIVKDYNTSDMYLLYFIYLLSTVSMYFISYKEILIMADQKNYQLTIYNFCSTVIMYLLQIYVLITYKSFVLYLLVMLIVKTIQRICINIYISHKYKNIDFHTKEKLPTKEKKSLKTNVKSLFYSKIGDYCIFSTDNIFISRLINLGVVGIYTNYISIVTMTRTLINSLFSGIVASFGNLAENASKQIQKNVFEIIDFMVFVLYGLLTIIFLNLINPFIHLWLGENYILEYSIIIIICLNFYLMGTQVSLDTIKQACGFYYKDRFVPLIQTIVNIVLSLVLGKLYGLFGILLATSISYLVLPIWIKPYLIYKHIFKDKCFQYFLREIKNFLVIISIYFITYFIINHYLVVNNIFSLVLCGLIILLIFTLIVTLLYFKTKEYQYFYDILKKIIFRKRCSNEKE